jgi:hypothetical protein
MGFRDVKNFNIAMLKKQGWRLMSNPDSLCAKVLKGKYFPQGDFMVARNKRNSSLTWCAFLAGRKALEMGLIRRIGDGTLTHIWNDRWIPSSIGNKPLCMKEGRSLKEAFEYIPGKVKNLIRGRSEKKLSGAAKETLLKFVAQAIPTYSMSYFLLSPDTCKKITTAMSNYWWSGLADKRSIH